MANQFTNIILYGMALQIILACSIDDSWKYLEQIPPNDNPIIFAPEIVSTTNLEHSSPIFTQDLKELYWVTFPLPTKDNNKTIYSIKYENDKWSTAKIADFSGQFSDDSPFIHDNKIYFTSNRGLEQLSDSLSSLHWSLKPNSRIWYCEYTDRGWGASKLHSSNSNTFNKQLSVSFSENGNMYFVGHLEGVSNQCGIFRSKLINGNYMSPDTLPNHINSISAQDWTPFISPDESYLIFSSYREDGFGSSDLYITFHDIYSDKWSEPLNMGGKINTSLQERFPYVSPDNKYLFFTRPREDYSQDIWWVKADIIEELRQNAIYNKN